MSSNSCVFDDAESFPDVCAFVKTFKPLIDEVSAMAQSSLYFDVQGVAPRIFRCDGGGFVRFAVGAVVIGETAGSFLGEYQAGGLIIVLNLANSRPTGFFTGTGMHGGKMFIRTEKSPENLSPKIEAKKASKADLKEIQKYIEEFCRLFSKDKDEILNSSFYVITPDSNNPYKELYVQN